MIVIVGASASGKSTLQKELINHNEKYHKVVSYTTRPKRKGEIDGVDYHFIEDDEFFDLIDDGFFAEYTQYAGWFYGTSKEDCENENSVAVLTPSGLRAMQRSGVNCTSFYLDVDRRSRLIHCLQRGDDIEEAYRRSLSDVGQFDGVENEVDYVIKNKGFIGDKIQVLSMVLSALGEEIPENNEETTEIEAKTLEEMSKVKITWRGCDG